ncbi:MAG: HesB/IscA family protein [Bacteriovoracaceae bacterium]
MVKITPTALDQLRLILTNDFTLKDKSLRISITGKECDGFVYAIGFDEQRAGDKLYKAADIDIIIDPFANFYLKNFIIDFQTNYEQDQEGFVVENLDQEKFHGKFWRDYPELAPQF